MRVVLETDGRPAGGRRCTPRTRRAARELIATRRPRALARRGHRADVEALNLAFHEAVYGLHSPTMSRELADNLRGYWTRALRYRLVYWSQPSAIELSRAAHETILDGLAGTGRRRRPNGPSPTTSSRRCGRSPRGSTSRRARRRHALRALADRYGVDAPGDGLDGGPMTQPLRSLLFCPATAPRPLAKLPSIGADAVAIDLEDAVTNDRKVDARAELRAALEQFADVRTYVRVNHPSTGTDRRRHRRRDPSEPRRHRAAEGRRTPRPCGPPTPG